MRTFSKGEWERLMEACGFSYHRFYYPYPDYKFPTTIYSDHCLPGRGELLNNLRNFDADRYVIFDETRAFDSIVDCGYFPIFSNSFFVRVKRKAE